MHDNMYNVHCDFTAARTKLINLKFTSKLEVYMHNPRLDYVRNFTDKRQNILQLTLFHCCMVAESVN